MPFLNLWISDLNVTLDAIKKFIATNSRLAAVAPILEI